MRLPASARIEAVDLSNASALHALPAERFDYIFHLAANTNFTGSVKRPYDDFLDNVVATINLLEYIRRRTPTSHLVFTSSAHVYGEGTTERISEDISAQPMSPYGAGKACAELYIRLYARIYGVRAAIARLFPLYGPGLRRYVVFDFMRKLASELSVRIHGDGSQIRDLNYIDNVIDALMIIAAKARYDGDVYNVASGAHISIAELAALIAQTMHVTPRFEFSGELAPGEIARWVPDISALASLGYRSQVSLHDGLARTVAWFKTERTRHMRDQKRHDP